MLIHIKLRHAYIYLQFHYAYITTISPCLDAHNFNMLLCPYIRHAYTPTISLCLYTHNFIAHIYLLFRRAYTPTIS